MLIGAQLDRRALRHFRLTNLVVHDVWGGPVQTKASGLVVFAPEGDHPVFDDILIDGVTAYNTNQWGGIIVNGGNWPIDMDNPAFGSGIIVRNSTVYNVYGDGIALWYVQDGLIEHCVAFDTGQQPPPQTIGTPNAIWTWACLNCTVQFNEAYRAASPEVDAGCFDIDWATQNNVIQYNYGHDSDGYCLAVFGAEGITTVNAIVRYNVCQNNARRADMALRQGDMFLSTWNGGALDGVQIYNNIFFWNPAQQAPLLKNTATFRGNRPAFFRHNRIYSMVSPLLDTNDSLECDHNLYWVADTGPTLTSALAGSDARAPLHLLGSDGAEQTVLVGFVNALADGSTRDLSRSQIVFLKSMARQYESIRVILVDTSGADTQTLAQAAQGWQLPLLPDEEGTIRAGFGITQPPATVLIGPDGGLIHRWDRFVAAQTLAFALQGIVGLPRFST